MKLVGDHKKLCEIAIPGTHDSGAFKVSGKIGETQEWDIKQQLENGIRFLDVRISNIDPENDSPLLGRRRKASSSRFYDSANDFEVRHGMLKLGSFKEIVMKPVDQFLVQNPTETIIMSIKPENKELDISLFERDFVHKKEYKFYQNTVIPQTILGEVRGKIVLFKRYSNDNKIGVEWGNHMKIQDHYKLHKLCDRIFSGDEDCPFPIMLNYERKAEKVIRFFDSSVENFGDYFQVNFVSAQYLGMFIKSNAKVVNKAVLRYFQSHKSTNIGCIIPMDYVNLRPSLIESIVKNNFQPV